MGNFIRNFGCKIGWMKVVLVVIVFFNLNGLKSQTTSTIYSEDFSTNSGKGNNAGAYDVSGVTNWSINNPISTIEANEYWKVNNNRFEAYGRISNASTTTYGYWYSNSIDISAYAEVSFSLLIGQTATSSSKGTDGIFVYASIDGGQYVPIDSLYNQSTSASSKTVSVSNFVGNSLILRVSVNQTNSNDLTHIWYFDDILVTGISANRVTGLSGSGNFIVPVGTTNVYAYAWGAGGGGGSGNSNGGGGGGGGAYSSSTLSITDPSVQNTFYYSIGSGGVGGRNSPVITATNGGDTWLNITNAIPTSISGVLAKGGLKGGDNTPASPASNASGGASGSGFGTYKYSGGNGGGGGGNGGGGGGSSAGFKKSGLNGVDLGSGANNVLGGASNFLGGSSGGTGVVSGNGGNGNNYGGGGGGSDDNTSSIGGAGGGGNLIVFYYSGPTITTSGSLSNFSACSGSNSSSQSFTVSGLNLTSDIVLTPPTGYEISQSSGSGYTSSTITLAQSGGSVSSTTIYVRTTTAATNGASGNITCTSTGATQKDIATGSATIETQNPTTATAGSDITIPNCATSSVVLGANTAIIGTGVWTITSGPNTNTNQLSSTSSINATFTPTGGAGTYVLRWTISNSCGSSFDEVSVIVSGNTYSGTLRVGQTGHHFTSLNDAISKLNTCGYSGNIILELQSNYDGTSTTEGGLNPMITIPSTFAGVASSATRTITIQPANGVNGKSITSSSNTGTILLNGADYIYFNGSPVGTPSSGATMSNTNNIIIINTHASTGYAIRFTGDATNNKIEYCNVKSNITTAASGVITFDTPSSATGNSNNQINYCEITKATTTPTNCIYSAGSATGVNTSNIINQCYIYDYFAAALAHSGILLIDYNTDWSITNNRFYQTSARDITDGGAYHRIINITYTSSAGNNFTISGNTIGGSASDNSGNYNFTGQSSATAGNFTGIYLKVGTTTVTSLTSNTIKNLLLNGVYTTASPGYEGAFNGIAVMAGMVNIGTVNSGNTIGSTSTSGSITYYTVGDDVPLHAIYINSPSTVNVNYNTIAGFSTSATQAAGDRVLLYGIYNLSNLNGASITYNTIGANSAHFTAGESGGSSTDHNKLYCIYNASSTNQTITNNTINYVDLYSTSTSPILKVISNNASSSASATISNNTISNITLERGTFYCIENNCSPTTSTTISNNTISSITRSSSSVATSSLFCGIYNASAFNTTISTNSIHTLTINNGQFVGIWDEGVITTSSIIHNINNNSIGNGTTDDNINISSIWNTTSGNTIFGGTCSSSCGFNHKGIYIVQGTLTSTNITTRNSSITDPAYLVNSNIIQTFTQSNDNGNQVTFTGLEMYAPASYNHYFQLKENTINKLKYTNNSDRSITMTGISVSVGGIATKGFEITKNKISECQISAIRSSNYSTFNGIYISNSYSPMHVTNNLVHFDNNLSTNGLVIYGLRLATNNSPTCYVNYNTIYIGGSDSGTSLSGNSSVQCALSLDGGTNTVYNNNIFINNRSSAFASLKGVIIRGSTLPTSTNWKYNYCWVNSSNTSNFVVYPSNSSTSASAWLTTYTNDINNATSNKTLISVGTNGAISCTDASVVELGLDLRSITGCSDDIASTTRAFDISVTPNTGGTKGCYEVITPTLTFASNPQSATAVCYNTSSQTSSLVYTASTGSPNSYTIDWNASANTANYNDQTATSHTFVSGGSTISDLAVSAGVAAATYSGTITATNTNTGCSSPTYNITIVVNPIPTAVTVTGGGAICSGSSASLSASNGSSGTIYWQNTTSSGISTGTASTSQSISSAGTYYFRAQSSEGCWGTEGSATITVNALPTAVTVTGGGTICSGSSANLSASNGSSGTIYWQNTTSSGTSTGTASTSQSVSSAGTYYFRARSAEGCWGTEGSATITVNPLPTITTAATPAVITGVNYNASAQTSSLVISSSTGSASSYTIDWDVTANTASLTDQTSTNHTFSDGGSTITNITIPGGVAAGTYSGTLTFTNAAGCSGNQTVSIIISSGVTTFYYDGSGSMATLSNWGSNTNGTGTNPSSITGNNLTFYITHNNTIAPSSTEVTWTLGTGSKIIVGDGSNSTNFTINAGNTISGTIDVSDNATLTVSTDTPPTLGSLSNTSTVIFNGDASQNVTIASGKTFGKLTLNNSNGATLTDNATIENTLTLTSGKLIVPASGTLTLGTSSISGNINISGGTTSSSYIVTTNNTSSIKCYINSKNNVDYFFPMGDASHYTPMTFTLNNSTGSISNAYLTTYVVDGVTPGFVTSSFGTYLTRYWSVTQSGITSPNYNISYTYDQPSDVAGATANEANLIPVKVSSGTWYKPTTNTNTGLAPTITNGTAEGTGGVDVNTNTLTWSGLSTFSFDTGAGDEAAALPIHLLYFTAKPEAKKVRLDWATASETNNDYFTVERSEDGEHFNELFKKPGAGISTTNLYYFGYDNKPLPGISYYRLKQTDYDGKFAYSDVESVSLYGSDRENTMELKIYPNPAENGKFHLSFDAKQSEKYSISIYDAVGKLIYHQDYQAEKGINDYTIELPDVAAGMYQLEVKNDNVGVITKSIEF